MRSPQGRGTFIRACESLDQQGLACGKQILPPLGTTWHGHNHCLESVQQSPPTMGPGTPFLQVVGKLPSVQLPLVLKEPGWVPLVELSCQKAGKGKAGVCWGWKPTRSSI